MTGKVDFQYSVVSSGPESIVTPGSNLGFNIDWQYDGFYPRKDQDGNLVITSNNAVNRIPAAFGPSPNIPIAEPYECFALVKFMTGSSQHGEFSVLQALYGNFPATTDLVVKKTPDAKLSLFLLYQDNTPTIIKSLEHPIEQNKFLEVGWVAYPGSDPNKHFLALIIDGIEVSTIEVPIPIPIVAIVSIDSAQIITDYDIRLTYKEINLNTLKSDFSKYCIIPPIEDVGRGLQVYRRDNCNYELSRCDKLGTAIPVQIRKDFVELRSGDECFSINLKNLQVSDDDEISNIVMSDSLGNMFMLDFSNIVHRKLLVVEDGNFKLVDEELKDIFPFDPCKASCFEFQREIGLKKVVVSYPDFPDEPPVEKYQLCSIRKCCCGDDQITIDVHHDTDIGWNGSYFEVTAYISVVVNGSDEGVTFGFATEPHYDGTILQFGPYSALFHADGPKSPNIIEVHLYAQSIEDPTVRVYFTIKIHPEP